MTQESKNKKIGDLKNLLNEIDFSRTNNVPQSNVGLAEGIFDAGMQGLTLGFSDEISAGAGAAFDSVFTDKSFTDSFDERVKQNRADLASFAESNPKTALSAEIGGAVLPVITSLALSPFSGGTSAVPGVATVGRILANPLLAGKIAQPGGGLLSRMYEGGKIGTIQGLASGFGYSDGNFLERTLPTLGSGAIGLALGSGIPALTRGIGTVFNKVEDRNILDAAEKKALRIITDQFLKDEISLDEVVLKIQQNLSADKLENITPTEILADYGGDAVLRKLRGINIRVPGENVSETLINRTSGTTEGKLDDLIQGTDSNIQSQRILQSLDSSVDDAFETEGINLVGGIDDIVQTIDKKLDPLYKKSFAENIAVDNLELYKYINSTPILQKAYKDAIDLFNEKLFARGEQKIEIPKLKDLFVRENGKIIDVEKNLPLEFLDMIKRVADQQTFEKILKGKINKQQSGPRKLIANNFRDLLKNSVKGDDYISALNQSSDKFLLQVAFELGTKLHKKSATSEFFNKQFNNLKSLAEKDAFRVGVFNEILKDITQTADNIDLSKKLTGSPDLRRKIDILFIGNPEAKEQFLTRLIREANMSNTTNVVASGSNTAEKLFDAGTVTQTASDMAVAMNEPTSSAGIRAISNLYEGAKSAIQNPNKNVAATAGKILLETDPEEQAKILENMLKLQAQREREKTLQQMISRSLIRGSQGQTNIFEAQ